MGKHDPEKCLEYKSWTGPQHQTYHATPLLSLTGTLVNYRKKNGPWLEIPCGSGTRPPLLRDLNAFLHGDCWNRHRFDANVLPTDPHRHACNPIKQSWTDNASLSHYLIFCISFAYRMPVDFACWHPIIKSRSHFNTLRLRQNGRHFADDTFKCIFLNEKVRFF